MHSKPRTDLRFLLCISWKRCMTNCFVAYLTLLVTSGHASDQTENAFQWIVQNFLVHFFGIGIINTRILCSIIGRHLASARMLVRVYKPEMDDLCDDCFVQSIK